MCTFACVLSHFSCVLLFATPWAVTRQAPLFMGFSRQEYWSGQLSPSPGDLPNPGIQLKSPMSPALAGGFLTTSATEKPFQVLPCPSPHTHTHTQKHYSNSRRHLQSISMMMKSFKSPYSPIKTFRKKHVSCWFSFKTKD